MLQQVFTCAQESAGVELGSFLLEPVAWVVHR